MKCAAPSLVPAEFVTQLAPLILLVLCLAVGGCSSFNSTAMSNAALPLNVSMRRPVANHVLRAPYPVQTLCVGSTLYSTTQDDEFSQDKTLNYSSKIIRATPQPNGVMWSSRMYGLEDGGARKNIGTDDAYYTDPTRGFGGYNPYSFSNGALNIRAEPVPKPYATYKPLDGAHWLSGLLEGPAQTYGYVEVSSTQPNLQGFFPASLWLLGLNGDDGNGNGYEELDANEMFGANKPPGTVAQTQTFSEQGVPPSNHVLTVVSPDPGKNFHTYGVLWTPDIVQFFIDRQATTPVYQNAANGPANAIINLGVFAKGSWSPPPLNNSPQITRLRYYRWYQDTGTSCSPSQLPAS